MKLILKAPIKQHRIKIYGRLKLLYIENYTPLIDHFQCALKDIQCLYEKNLGIGIGKNRKSEITGRDTDYPVFLSVILFTFPSSPVCLSFPPMDFRYLCPHSSTSLLPQSPPSSPRSTPSASPHTPRGCGRKHCGRVFYRRAIWGNSGLQRDGR